MTQFEQGCARSQRRFFSRHSRHDSGGLFHRWTIVIGLPLLSRFMLSYTWNGVLLGLKVDLAVRGHPRVRFSYMW
jgi:hypothetical protein